MRWGRGVGGERLGPHPTCPPASRRLSWRRSTGRSWSGAASAGSGRCSREAPPAGGRAAWRPPEPGWHAPGPQDPLRNKACGLLFAPPLPPPRVLLYVSAPTPLPGLVYTCPEQIKCRMPNHCDNLVPKKYALLIWNSNLCGRPRFHVLNLATLAFPYAPAQGIRGTLSSELPQPPLHVQTWYLHSPSRIGWLNLGTPKTGCVIVSVCLVRQVARILEPLGTALLMPCLM